MLHTRDTRFDCRMADRFFFIDQNVRKSNKENGVPVTLHYTKWRKSLDSR